MKISVLCDNSSSDIGCLAEWGFSLYIEFENIKILFDAWYSEVYKHNANHLDINLDDVDFTVLSHFHNDHSRGLKFHDFKSRKKLIIHPDIVKKLPIDESQKLNNDFEMITSREPLEFSKNMYYLGEIPRKNDFENGEYQWDKMLDDSAIIFKTNKWVIVISGCSHSWICNICDYAKFISGKNLYAVIGGFHLFENENETKNNTVTIKNTIEYFEKEKIEHLIPMHCIDFTVFQKLHTKFNCKKYSAGDIIEIN